MTARVIPFPHSRVAAGPSAAASLDWDASFVVLGLLRTAHGEVRGNRHLILREDPGGAWELTVTHPDCSVDVCLRGDRASRACDLLATLQRAIFAPLVGDERAADQEGLP